MGACASVSNDDDFTGLDVKGVKSADGHGAKGAKGASSNSTAPSSESDATAEEELEGELDPEKSAMHRDAGNTAYLASDLEKAYEEYCLALRSLPRKEARSGTPAGEQRCIILSNKAQVQLRRREWVAAAKAAEEALSIDSSHEPSEQRLRLANVHIAAEMLIHPDAIRPPDMDDDDDEYGGPPEVVDSSDDEPDEPHSSLRVG